MNKRYTIKLVKIDDVKEFVKICSRYDEDINVYKGRYTIDGKSLMGMFVLDLTTPVEVEILSNEMEVCNTFEDEIEAFVVK